MDEFEQIIYEVVNKTAKITLNRPKKLNALTLQLQAELSEALWEADNDREVHSVIIKGAGRAFSAGYDLTGGGNKVPVSRIQSENRAYRGGRSIDDDAWQLERGQRYRMALFDMHKPVIAQVHGYCLAGGTDIALLCDMVIAADDAIFGFPPARDLGALPNNMWLYNVGPQWAKRLTLTGDTVTGSEAQSIGLILKSVPGENLEQEVEGLASRMSHIDPDLLSANKRIINTGLELMGARTLQRMAAENDVRGHNTKAASNYRDSVVEKGLKKTLQERDAKFGDGRAKVFGPEIRAEKGKLIE